MTHSFKLSRRIARLRVPMAAALVFALVSCDNSQSFQPSETLPVGTSDPAVPAAEGVTPVALGEPSTASVSFAGGIPIGLSAMPLTAYGSLHNGSKSTIAPNLLANELSTIRSRGGKVVLMMAGNENYYKDADGHFSLTKWKARVDRYRNVNIASYITDGTIIAHYLIDEPNDPANWNGRPVPGTVVEEMAKYSKGLWPGLPTVVRTHPDYLKKTGGSYRYLDGAWAQYLARRGDVNDYIRRNVADAQDLGLALVVGLNVLKGGTPNGTRMSASEVKEYGSALLSSSYPCAFISWQYNDDYLSTSGMKEALTYLRGKAENRATKSCRG